MDFRAWFPGLPSNIYIYMYITIYIYIWCTYIEYKCAYITVKNHVYKCLFLSKCCFKLSELLPNIRDLVCGCQTTQISFWMHQFMSKTRQTVQKGIGSTICETRFPQGPDPGISVAKIHVKHIYTYKHIFVYICMQLLWIYVETGEEILMWIYNIYIGICKYTLFNTDRVYYCTVSYAGTYTVP